MKFYILVLISALSVFAEVDKNTIYLGMNLTKITTSVDEAGGGDFDTDFDLGGSLGGTTEWMDINEQSYVRYGAFVQFRRTTSTISFEGLGKTTSNMMLVSLMMPLGVIYDEGEFYGGLGGQFHFTWGAENTVIDQDGNETTSDLLDENIIGYIDLGIELTLGTKFLESGRFELYYYHGLMDISGSKANGASVNTSTIGIRIGYYEEFAN